MKCGKGFICEETDGYQHYKVVAGPASKALKGKVAGKNAKQQKWAVPEMLQDKMFRSIPMEKRSMANGEKRYVIDLFAGGQSLKPVAVKTQSGLHCC